MAKNTSGKSSVLIRRASGNLAVAVYGEDSPTNEEWQVYLETMRTLQAGYRMIIFSTGGGPNTMQRRDLENVTSGQGQKERVAVVTLSRLARGIVTAIAWFNRDIKAFEPSEREKAFEFLSFTPSEKTEVLRYAKEMAAELEVAELLLLAG